MEQLILQRLNSIENRLHEINTLQDEGKKWRIILQHWIRKNFDFDVENQMNKPDILAFYYEPPSVGQILGKNIQVLPQLENIIMKQQLEIADYIKKLNSRIVQQSQNQMVHHNSVPSGSSSSSSSRMVPTTIQQQPHNQSLYHHHHHQTQTQKNPNLISQMNKNQSTFSQNEHQPHQTNRQRIQQHHNFVQNQQMLQKQKQQQREIAWLNQISRPTGPGPGSSGPDHVRNISRRNSPQNLGQHSMQHSVQNQRHNNDLSIEEAVGTTRTMQLQRLPVTIEKINVPAPVSLSTSNHQQTSSSSSDRQRISAAPGVVPGMRNSHGVGNRNISSTVSYSSNFQQDDGGRLCPGSVQQQQQQRNNVMTSQNSSVPFAYECQTCQIKFRHKSAAQLHVAKVHSLKQKPSHPAANAADVLSSTSNSQIHEQTRPAPRTMSVTGDMGDDDNTMPIIMSVAGGGKRYVRKEQTRITSAPISLPVSVPAGLSISINSDLPAPPPPAASNNNSTIFPATTATRNLAAVPGQSRVLDEITISDDEDEADQYNQQNQNSISSSSMATTTTAGPPSAVGDRIPCETRLTYATNDDGDEIICDPLAEDSQLQNPRISTAPASNVQQSSSPTSSSPVQKSSTFILSSKLSTLLSGAGSRVGGKRPSDIPSHSGRTSTSSPDKRNRPNENLSSDTIPENLEIAPEINLYTDDDGEYSEFQSPTSAGDAADGVVTMNDDELVSPDGLNNNSVGCHDDNEEEAGDDFNDGS